MASALPTYVTAAKPVPQENRAPWFKTTAQTYAGIMLWFAFWQSIPAGDGSPGVVALDKVADPQRFAGG